MSRPTPCRHCRAPVLLVRKADPRPGTSNWVVLDTTLLDPARQHDGRMVRIINGEHAYTIGHARDTLDELAGVLARPDDATHAEDLPWHRIHQCPTREPRA